MPIFDQRESIKLWRRNYARSTDCICTEDDFLESGSNIARRRHEKQCFEVENKAVRVKGWFSFQSSCSVGDLHFHWMMNIIWSCDANLGICQFTIDIHGSFMRSRTGNPCISGRTPLGFCTGKWELSLDHVLGWMLPHSLSRTHSGRPINLSAQQHIHEQRMLVFAGKRSALPRYAFLRWYIEGASDQL